MRISIFGMGYVGVVSACCLAKEGHKIVGVDPVQTKTDFLNKGQAPIVEKNVDKLIATAVNSGLLKATNDTAGAINETEISIICVGTPSHLNGDLDLKYIRRVCEEIGTVIKDKIERHVVVIRSTILPGTMERVVMPILEEFSGKKAGDDFGVCFHPEFMREGSAVNDYFNPSRIIIGEIDRDSGDLLASIYEGSSAPLNRTDVKTAEMIKYTDNAWHALKVCFANEIGNIAKAQGIDGRRIMDIFCQDKKLNLSKYYLKPGFAFGGSCLPKDIQALTNKARALNLKLPILNAILASNELQVERAKRLIMEKGNKKVGVLGFTFKAGTDDLRESPVVKMIKGLLDKDYDVRIYDKNVNLDSLIGTNRDYILHHIPNIKNIKVTRLKDILDNAETIVIGNYDAEFKNIFAKINSDQTVVDLVGITGLRGTEGKYDGICW